MTHMSAAAVHRPHGTDAIDSCPPTPPFPPPSPPEPDRKENEKEQIPSSKETRGTPISLEGMRGGISRKPVETLARRNGCPRRSPSWSIASPELDATPVSSRSLPTARVPPDTLYQLRVPPRPTPFPRKNRGCWRLVIPGLERLQDTNPMLPASSERSLAPYFLLCPGSSLVYGSQAHEVLHVLVRNGRPCRLVGPRHLRQDLDQNLLHLSRKHPACRVVFPCVTQQRRATKEPSNRGVPLRPDGDATAIVPASGLRTAIQKTRQRRRRWLREPGSMNRPQGPDRGGVTNPHHEATRRGNYGTTTTLSTLSILPRAAWLETPQERGQVNVLPGFHRFWNICRGTESYKPTGRTIRPSFPRSPRSARRSTPVSHLCAPAFCHPP